MSTQTKTYAATLLGLLLSVSAANAQMDTRRASIGGGGGDEGKCAIEVRVDIAAEVEVSGDMGRIRTLSGRPANWVRFECNRPLPRDPSDFRFKGIDGRGQVNLVRDPRSGRGTAVIRIEDPKGGDEGYTFDLLWRGGSDYDNRSGGIGRDRDYNNNRRNDDYDRRDRDYDRRSQRSGRDNARIVTCGSNDGRRQYCDADTRDGVQLLRKIGNAPCRQGSTWGFDRRGIWVDRGCRAEFELRR